MSHARSRSASLAHVLLAYVLAIGVGAAWLYLGPDTAHLWLDGLIADVLATLVIFGFSRAHGNSSFYDAYWSVLPPLLAVWWWSEAPAANDLRAALVTGVILVWAVRLTGNWIHLWPGLHHEDWRYAQLREGRTGAAAVLVDLFAIHLVPTLQVFLGMVPVYVAVTYAGDVVWLDWVALAVGLGAVLLELVADTQMQRFARTAAPGAVMDRGLWGWSRHPNYLGEITFWLSLALFALAASPGDWWWVFVGFVAMVLLFRLASIPMVEERSLARRPAYRDVIDRVPMLVPRPPRRVTG